MAPMTIDSRAREAARTALTEATHAYGKALRDVDKARNRQHAAIIEARLEGVRQVDVTGLTQTPARPKGFTREHVRRIELAYRKRLRYARDQGMNVEAMTTEEILAIVLPGDEEDRAPLAAPLDIDDDEADMDEDGRMGPDDEDDDEADEDLPVGVIA